MSVALTGGRWILRRGIKVWVRNPSPLVVIAAPKPEVKPERLEANPTDLIQAAADAYHVSPLDIIANVPRLASPDLVDARHVSRWLLRKTGATVVAIGEMVSRNHSSIVSSIQRVDGDPGLLEVAEALLADFEGVRDEAAA